MTPDPMCPWQGYERAPDNVCWRCDTCRLIAKVREDERKRAIEIVDNTINDSGDRADAKDWIKGNRPDWATEGPL